MKDSAVGMGITGQIQHPTSNAKCKVWELGNDSSKAATGVVLGGGKAKRFDLDYSLLVKKTHGSKGVSGIDFTL